MLWDTLLSNEFEEMRREMDVLADWNGLAAGHGLAFPPLNAYEGKDEYLLIAFVPGLAKEAIDIRVEEESITLKGGRALPVEETAERAYMRHERDHGDFEKTFRFPAKLERKGVTARLENGILVIRAPKAEDAKPRQIQIKG